jgi:acyl carrier protein phosphodiesterase
MNYLAHFYLSYGNENLILGNLIADSVKGRLNSANFVGISPEILQGIKLHREIDRYTDTHPIVKQSITRLKPKYGLYAGVLVDMYYDHLLARNWNIYSNEPLELFVARIYQLFLQKKQQIPVSMAKMVHSMIERDWLCNYRNEETLQWAFAGLARRAKFESKMEQGLEDLLENYLDFLQDFLAFFPQINAHCKNFLANNTVPNI